MRNNIISNLRVWMTSFLPSISAGAVYPLLAVLVPLFRRSHHAVVEKDPGQPLHKLVHLEKNKLSVEVTTWIIEINMYAWRVKLYSGTGYFMHYKPSLEALSPLRWLPSLPSWPGSEVQCSDPPSSYDRLHPWWKPPSVEQSQAASSPISQLGCPQSGTCCFAASPRDCGKSAPHNSTVVHTIAPFNPLLVLYLPCFLLCRTPVITMTASIWLCIM